MKNSKASLIVVGSGIKFMSHLTTEAKAYIEQSDKVLYLVNDPAMQNWISKANKNAESLEEIYIQHPLRLSSYRAITDYILKNLRLNLNVCVVMYGHPTVFSKPAVDAVKQARKEGYYAKILPSISAEACLLADLLIDPSSKGCQSFEATELLIHSRIIDNKSHLILWQVGLIGQLGHNKLTTEQGLQALTHYLKNYYPEEHPIVLYEAAQYPHLEPKIETFSLRELCKMIFSSLSTLYITPFENLTLNHDMLEELNINISDLF